ncbi:MAG: ABC transporter ATP-binding protein [Acidimicrobiia bacterium]|nr:ABC transporter ATP-binding protein [Acidimicrobiia bacterium]
MSTDPSSHHGSGRQVLLDVKALRASYGVVEVLRGIDFSVDQGEIAVILGANGAGKTTSLRAVCGMITTSGSVQLAGEEIIDRKTHEIVRRGVAHVPQGRGTFPDLSVADNMLAGAFIRDDDEIADDIARWYETFPVLGERREQPAGNLSGGEQQMLAVARALMSRPDLLLLDEPSLGLAPIVTEQLFETFAELNANEGVTMLIVEQNASLALGIAQHGYVLEAGEIVLSGTGEELSGDDSVRAAYLGY